MYVCMHASMYVCMQPCMYVSMFVCMSVRKYNVPGCTTNYPKVAAMQAHSTVMQSNPEVGSTCQSHSQRVVGKVWGYRITC